MSGGGSFDPGHLWAAGVTDAEHPTHRSDLDPPKTYAGLQWAAVLAVLAIPMIIWLVSVARAR